MQIRIIKSIIVPCVIIAFFLNVKHGTTQNISREESDIIQQLIAAYNDFNYKKTEELLTLAFRSINKFSSSQQILIYQYAAFLAFQNANSALAVNHFWNLLRIDPVYSLDPVTTPPKILTLFQKTKIEFLEDLNRRLNSSSIFMEKKPFPWRSFLFPGWEQWHRDYKTAGIIYAGMGTITIAGFIHAFITTRQKENSYKTENNPQLISSIYNEYNDYYKRQYIFSYAFVALWIWSQLDIALWRSSRISFQTTGNEVNSKSRHNGFKLTISLNK